MRTCENCYFEYNGICQRIKGAAVSKTQEACPLYINRYNIKTCAGCGGPILSATTYEHDTLICTCAECNANYGTCATCTKGQSCDFMESDINLPKTTIQTVRKGNMVAQQQVPNPERIKETCVKNCACYNSEENACLRQGDYCIKYLCKWNNKGEE